MVTEKDLLDIKRNFRTYVRQLYTGDESVDSALRIKECHTVNVELEILDLSNSLRLTAEECYSAQIIAYLHDIGRFEQFIRYLTFADMQSVDHALLGVEILAANGIIDCLDTLDRNLITEVIVHHNRATLPENMNPRSLFFLKILRDADKIDIFRVVTGHYSGFERNDAIRIGLPDNCGISDAVVRRVINGKTVRMEEVKTFDDFKMLQIGWIFDLNFVRAFEIVKKRRYLDKIAAVLPQTDSIVQAIRTARIYLEEHCADERNGSNA
jgi:sulfur carrier protein ThiS